MNKSPVLGVCFAALTMMTGCLIVDDGDGGNDSGGGGSGANGGNGGAGGDGGTGAIGGNGGNGGGEGFCEFGPNCDPSLEGECGCLGCGATECADIEGNATADCVCPICAEDSFCNDTSNCTDNGACDPLNEGCLCADCLGHPACG